MLAHALRLAIGLGGGLLSVAVVWTLEPAWRAWVVAGAGFVFSGWLAEKAWRRTASPRQVADDLADRVRNPPS